MSTHQGRFKYDGKSLRLFSGGAVCQMVLGSEYWVLGHLSNKPCCPVNDKLITKSKHTPQLLNIA